MKESKKKNTTKYKIRKINFILFCLSFSVLKTATQQHEGKKVSE